MIEFVFESNDDESVRKLSLYIEGLNQKDKDKKGKYIINIKKHFHNRSNEQNRRYRAILKTIGIHSGNTVDELHEMYKKKFHGKWILDELVGESTKNMDTREFTIYMNEVETHGKEFFNAVFKHPEDDKYLEWESQVNDHYNRMMISI